DNYDSFTWNLWHFLSDLGAEVTTIRNDAKSVEEILAMQPSGLVLSPGPGVPADAGILVDLIKAAPASLPIMGVCLGHQAICTAFGGKLKHFSPPMHGKLSYITHQNQGIFEGIDSEFVVTRYHSLLADEAYLPDCLNITAATADGKIMGLQHQSRPIHGVQFHPESIASAGGYRLLRAFLALTGQNKLPDEAEMLRLESQLLALDKKFPDQVHV
ncbi:MAG: aminodeoxychorismate/anthranilate synthase component II, partial [Pseudomonadota bacterium]|nr:aminodeoxychorismate/anthranilate synthase component II [Pseudomonadota bacterium]